jgi:pimeloyl-ACP methyl ester carboxylesterase
VPRVVFLPGIGGRGAIWAAVAERLSEPDHLLFDWPGFSDVPEDTHVRSLSDLVDLVLARIDAPVDLVAQSLGGVVATHLALRRPDLVRRLVLSGTSAGADVTPLGLNASRLPGAPSWFVRDDPDTTLLLPDIKVPVLLIWGEEDAINPPAVGEYLTRLFPSAKLVALPGASHFAPVEQPDAMARHIQAFLEESGR